MSSGLGSPSASPAAVIETQVAPTSPTANRRPRADLLMFSLRVMIDSRRLRSNGTTPYLPRSTGAGLALPNTPFFIMWTMTPSDSCSTRIGVRYGSGARWNVAEIRPPVATALADGSLPRTFHDMIHLALGSCWDSKNGRRALVKASAA